MNAHLSTRLYSFRQHADRVRDEQGPGAVRLEGVRVRGGPVRRRHDAVHLLPPELPLQHDGRHEDQVRPHFRRLPEGALL